MSKKTKVIGSIFLAALVSYWIYIAYVIYFGNGGLNFESNEEAVVLEAIGSDPPAVGRAREKDAETTNE